MTVIVDYNEDDLGKNVEATYHDSGDSIYRGKVVYEDDEYAEENGTVTVDEYAIEKETA